MQLYLVQEHPKERGWLLVPDYIPVRANES